MATANPLDIFKRTPKTNCGECGYPACLAFCAAVAKTGEDPAKCPYLNIQGLELQEAAATDGDGLARERDLEFVEHLKGKIADKDFSQLAAPLGADWRPEDPNLLSFSYLNQEVLLSKTGIKLDGNEPEDPRDMILLYNYVFQGGGRGPDDEWVGLESLPNTISKVRTLTTYCEEPLARFFSGKDANSINALGRQLGAGPGPGVSASVEMIVPVLPVLPQYVLYWEAEPEDGFEARVKVLFDHHVLDVLDVESLVFSAERLAERFLGLG